MCYLGKFIQGVFKNSSKKSFTNPAGIASEILPSVISAEIDIVMYFFLQIVFRDPDGTCSDIPTLFSEILPKILQELLRRL